MPDGQPLLEDWDSDESTPEPPERLYNRCIRVWLTLFRLRYAFFVGIAFSILLALFASFLMEVFFLGTMNPTMLLMARWKWIVLFWCLPWLMISLALIGDEMCDLIMDILDDPPLTQFQGLLVTAWHIRSKRDDATWPGAHHLQRADRINITIFEIVPIVVAFASPFLVGDLNPKIIALGYVQGSLVAAMLCAIVFVVSDIKVSNWMSKDASIQEKMRVSIKQLNNKKIQPYFLSGRVKPRPERHYTVGSAGGSAGGDAERTRAIWPMWALSAVVVAWTACSLSYTHFNANPDWSDPVILGTALILTVLVCTWCLGHACPGIFGLPYLFILWFFVLVGVCLTMGTAVRMEGGGPMQPIMTVLPEAAPGSDLPRRWLGSAGVPGDPPPYPVCGMSWGSPHAPLQALDLASLAWIIYNQEDPQVDSGEAPQIAQLLRATFPPEMGAQLVSFTRYEELPRWGHFYFPPQGNATGGTRVVAVKGTSTILDALFDTNLFSMIQVLQTIQLLVPVITLLPRLVIEWLLANMHIPAVRLLENKMLNDLKEQVQALKQEYPKDSFVITGHSLGGGISEIVAASLNIPSLVWSAPGAVYSSQRFGIQVQLLKRNVVSVMPDHDVVPRVDLQAGMLQRIECRTRDGEQSTAPNCHLLCKTACEVWRVCGDSRGRDFRRTCSKYVANSSLGRAFRLDDTTAI